MVIGGNSLIGQICNRFARLATAGRLGARFWDRGVSENHVALLATDAPTFHFARGELGKKAHLWVLIFGENDVLKGAKPTPQGNVIPMRGDRDRPAPEPLEWMTDLGKEVWVELAVDLTRMDRLASHYRHQFASYCEAVANFIRATNDIALHGVWYETKTRNGVQHKKTAAWSAQNEAMNQMRRDAALFGLTPVDESRIGSGDQGDFLKLLTAQLKGESGASS